MSYPICDTFECLVNSCEFVVLWPNTHACPSGIPSITGGCLLQDPSDGSKFDLEQLSNNSYVVDTSGQYIFGLCGTISKVV